MRRLLGLITLVTTLLCLPGTLVWADDPVRWSAPMSEYPTQWVPTPQPPSYYNMYGYQYPYAAYDAYGFGAYGAYYGAYSGYGAYGRQGYYGNPYSYYYGR